VGEDRDQRRAQHPGACALTDVTGCRRPPEFVVVGPIVGPPGLQVDPGRGFFARAYPCAEHLTECRHWMHDPEVFPIQQSALADELLQRVASGFEILTLRAQKGAA
jgi:hypothetical protein